MQQHSRCLHHIIAHTSDTDKHPVCTALAAIRRHFTNTACAILTTGAAFKVVCLSIKNQQSSLTDQFNTIPSLEHSKTGYIQG